MLKFKDLVEGVEYWLYVDGRCLFPFKYKIENNSLYNFDSGNWVKSEISLNFVLSATFVECEWVPKIGDTIHYPNPWEKQGFSYDMFIGHELDLRLMKRVGYYRTAEEAIAKAKKLGWT
jgi:hypothetical protein